MKKNTIVIIVLSITIVILLNYIIFSTVSKISIIEFLKLPVFGSIIVALVSIITVFLSNHFNLKKLKLENSHSIRIRRFEKEIEFYSKLWIILHSLKRLKGKVIEILISKKFEDLNNFIELINLINNECVNLLELDSMYAPFIPTYISRIILCIYFQLLKQVEIYKYSYQIKKFKITSHAYIDSIISKNYAKLFVSAEYRINQYENTN